MQYTIKTIAAASQAEFSDKGSRFLAFAFPMDSVQTFKEELQQLKNQHPKAVHHCFAYRLGTTKDNFRSSDDGEPSGTAGKPLLNQLDAFQVTDAGIIVVRYFGGVLLGVPGLINAYKTSGAAALRAATVIEKPILATLKINCDYNVLNDVMTIIKRQQFTIATKHIELFCRLEVQVPLHQLESSKEQFEKIRSVVVE